MFLPAEIVRDQRLKRNDIAVACAVWDAVPFERKSASDPWPFCMLSRRQLEESTGLTKSQVERALANLARLGHVTTVTIDRDTNTFWRRLNVMPAKQEGFGFKKYRADRSARVDSAIRQLAGESDALPTDDDFKPTASEMSHDPTPEDLSEVRFQDGDYQHVPYVDDEPDEVVVHASERFRPTQPQVDSTSDDSIVSALAIANAQRAALKITPIADSDAERAAITEAVRRCRELPADPRRDMVEAITMHELVGHAVASMAAAHVKGAKMKAHLADGHEATFVGLLARMRHAKRRDHMLQEGWLHARHGVEGPKNQSPAAASDHGPRR